MAKNIEPKLRKIRQIGIEKLLKMQLRITTGICWFILMSICLPRKKG